jgi:predicted DCC family thiol-disulfide oxidoreductase YuxK
MSPDEASIGRGHEEDGKSIVVFDGLCNFCNCWVRFVLNRDPSHRFHFASAQSETGAALLSAHGLSPQDLETMLLIEADRHYVKSDAVLQILRHLGGLWPALRLLRVLPMRLRDQAYSAFARRRYGWFGKSDACPVPDARWRDRFLG